MKKFKKLKWNRNNTMTYRTRRRLRRAGIACATVFVLAAAVLTCWFAWLDRYVVYSADGAHLEFVDDYRITGGVEALPPERPQVEIHYNEGDNIVNTSTDLGQITGFYATTSMLLDSIEDVTLAIENLPNNNAVMLDLKSIYGNFYYSTKLPGAPVTDQLDPSAVDRLISKLASSDTYLIARVPAFRDRNFGLNNTGYGLSSTSGKGYLWVDDSNCYWLDPTSTGAISYLISIATELRELGFDEVVFDEFRFPDTTNILFDGSRSDAIAAAAEAIVTSCATERFAVSFCTSDQAFPLPAGRSRLYLTDVSAAKVQNVADAMTFPIKEAQLVFLTETNDTRFDICSVLRPLPVGEVTAPEE